MKSICIVTRNMMGGGAERVLSELISYMISEKEIQVDLFLINKSPIHYSLPESCRIHEIGKLSDQPVRDKFMRYHKVRKEIRKISPDVVLSMPEEIGIYVLLTMLGSGIPVVVSERNNPKVMPDKKITRMLRTLLYPFANGIIFQTQGAASFFPEYLRKKSAILPNPVEVNKLPDPILDHREKIVMSVGRFFPQKNFPLLIDAFAIFQKSFPDYKLLIYGEGPLKDEVETYASERLASSSFEFPGKTDKVLSELNRAGLFVLSSDFEGVPNALIEAMCMGVPCVSTDCEPGGPASLIRDGINGYLVPTGNAEKMADKMKVLAQDCKLRNSFSIESVKLRETLDAAVVCQRWVNYLESHANGRQ